MRSLTHSPPTWGALLCARLWEHEDTETRASPALPSGSLQLRGLLPLSEEVGSMSTKFSSSSDIWWLEREQGGRPGWEPLGCHWGILGGHRYLSACRGRGAGPLLSSAGTKCKACLIGGPWWWGTKAGPCLAIATTGGTLGHWMR